MEAAVVLLGVMTTGAVVYAVRAAREARKARAALHDVGRADPLTRLPSRASLEEWLEGLLHDGRRTSARVAVLAIELHRFGFLNDTYGHEVGDALLAATAETLRRDIRKGELLVRFGGPLFIIALPDVPDSPAARARADHLVGLLVRPHQIGQDRIRLNVNVGVVVTDQHYTSAADVLFDARVALQTAVEEGAGSVAVFDGAKRGLAIPSIAVHRLHSALDADEFSLHYLPVVRTADQHIVGVEALLRWDDPDAGITSPARFLQALEESGLIIPVGRWALREACRQARAWQDLFPESAYEMTVNVSPRQLLQTDFTEMVDEVLESTGLEPGRLCLEITEGSLLLDVEPAWAVLREVRSRGVHLALDDFGSGTSSLSYLRRFRLDSLKIDRSFVTTVAESEEDEAVLGQLVGLAHALGMRAVAEGVETDEQLEVLRRLGCDLAQGYAFAAPGPADEVQEMLVLGRCPAPGDPAGAASVAEFTLPQREP
jgi:diguanylate cyclase (GGDEF)-like protein